MSRQRKKKGRPISGWIALDKPVGIGSTQCVSKLKWLYKAAKCGHAGTLDPLASGLLPIALGEATKTVPFVMDGEKRYRFTVTFGAQTATDDTEGEVIARSDERPTEDALRVALPRYVGEIEQVPPSFSAVKIDGERAYNLAREGEAPEIAARTVTVHRLDLLAFDGHTAELECDCGKGTYVRAIARDLGRELGCFGHVSALRRLSVGPFEAEDMIGLEELAAMEGDLAALDAEILPTASAFDDLPQVVLNPEQAARVRSGNAVLLRGRDAPTFAPEAYAVCGRELIALGEVEAGSFNPRRVFTVSAAG